ncbi:hypothetical protein EXIGLDRAFT_335411 [Exidia glandulosa HHB12029]|uniref:Uncharacterized protein n=1 Tax=Exidia glandulosa HHB12029 TaxID=1314781 RepID=A0A165CMI5_EXIGL|nr:hypothetical protein EXIGLDRAFT_335411 [Exidia glandulosa HHB12029]
MNASRKKKARSGTTIESAINIDDLSLDGEREWNNPTNLSIQKYEPNDDDDDAPVYTGWKAAQSNAPAPPSAPNRNVRKKTKRNVLPPPEPKASTSSARAASSTSRPVVPAKRPSTSSTEPPRKAPRTRQSASAAQRDVVILLSSDEEDVQPAISRQPKAASTSTTPIAFDSRVKSPTHSVSRMPSIASTATVEHANLSQYDVRLLNDDGDVHMLEPEDEKSPSPELDFFTDDFVYDIEPLPQFSLPYAPVDPDERSPSPEIGPLNDDFIYMLQSWTVDDEGKHKLSPFKTNSEESAELEARCAHYMKFKNEILPKDWVAPSRLRGGRVMEDYRLSLRHPEEYPASLALFDRIPPRDDDAGPRLAAHRARFSNGLQRAGLRLRNPNGHAGRRDIFPSERPTLLELQFSASGAVNEIVQHNGWIAAGCSTGDGVGGLTQRAAPDRRFVPTMANHPHSLAIFSGSKQRWLGADAHKRDLGRNDATGSGEYDRVIRHYTVDSVAWDPHHEYVVVYL